MPKFSVEFRSIKTITNKKSNECYKLIQFIRKHNNYGTHPTGANLARDMNLSAPEVRKLITIIRENATYFFEPGHYLIAGKKGYWISKKKSEIKAFMKKTHLMGVSKIKQFNEAEKLVGEADWETGV